MAGKLYIDSVDVHAKFGVFITDDGYKELVEYAPLKNVPSNNWQEEDGEEFDLSAPVLDSRELSVKFATHGSNSNLGAFIEMLSDKAYHMFEFKEIGRTYKLRLVSQPNLELYKRFGTFSLRFADDFPLCIEEDKLYYPNSSILPVQGYEIDSVDLSAYGVRVLEGSRAEIEKSPSVKKNLLRNIESQSGALYADHEVTFETKEIRLNCLMRASSLSEFWNNYDALLYALIQSEHRRLFVSATGSEYPCYYKNSSVSRFYPKDKIWFEFSLNLVFTSFRVGADEYILASENGAWIVTEDEINKINLEYGN